MKIHLSKIRRSQYGTKFTSLCGRLNKESQGGMNVTVEEKEVTCKFCKEKMEAKSAS